MSKQGVYLKLDSESTIVAKVIANTISRNTPQGAVKIKQTGIAQYDAETPTQASSTLTSPSNVITADAFAPGTYIAGIGGAPPSAVKFPTTASKITASDGIHIVQNQTNNTINLQGDPFNAVAMMLS